MHGVGGGGHLGAYTQEGPARSCSVSGMCFSTLPLIVVQWDILQESCPSWYNIRRLGKDHEYFSIMSLSFLQCLKYLLESRVVAAWVTHL